MERSCFNCKHYDYKAYVCMFEFASKCILNEDETARTCVNFKEGEFEYSKNSCPHCGCEITQISRLKDKIVDYQNALRDVIRHYQREMGEAEDEETVDKILRHYV